MTDTLPLTSDRDAQMRQQEKLAAHGKLSAGLFHELNNPAAAGRRAAKQLREALQSLQSRTLSLQWTNLIDNAIDAMNGQEKLETRTSRENDDVLVEIVDNGPGIPPAIQCRLWEPFFTTKGVGEGTGLGLDIARCIVVKRHKGNIRFFSEQGNTRFEVRLPINGQDRHSL